MGRVKEMTGTHAALVTPHPAATGGSGLSIIALWADDGSPLTRTLDAVGACDVEIGRPALRTVAGADRAVVVRIDRTRAQITPHGGEHVVNAILRALEAAGCATSDSEPATALYPEARDEVEALALGVLAGSSSPLASDVLLRQVSLWREPGVRACSEAEARALQRLLDPPTVVLIGPPNIGKSTLTNTLARRRVSIVADEPGTTRDHVGVTLDLAGLCVRWIDAPGVRSTSDPIEHEAIGLARRAAAGADLILLACDPASSFVDDPSFESPGAIVRRVGLRADTGPLSGCDAVTAAARGEGLASLASVVREALVPAAVVAARARWRFHPRLPRAGA